MASIRIVNWKTFQHYKERRPPWIKLHRSLLEKREWIELSADASKLLVNLWIIASDSDEGVIERTADDIAWSLRIPGPQLVLKWLKELQSKHFIEYSEDDASTPLADRLHVAAPETEERQRTEGETKKKARSTKGWKDVPADWEPNDLHRALAKAEGLDFDRQLALFRDHRFEKPKTDADKAFNTWLRRANEFAGRRNTAPKAKQQFDYDNTTSEFKGFAS